MLSSWHLTTINPADISDILKIERNAFKNPWSRDALLNELSCKGASNYAVKHNHVQGQDTIIAYGFFRLAGPELHILKIAVAHKWRGDGVASWLLNECFKQALKKGVNCAFLEVRPSNHPAIKLYQKLEFQIIGRRPNYYPETREDALVLMKNLKEET